MAFYMLLLFIGVWMPTTMLAILRPALNVLFGRRKRFLETVFENLPKKVTGVFASKQLRT